MTVENGIDKNIQDSGIIRVVRVPAVGVSFGNRQRILKDLKRAYDEKKYIPNIRLVPEEDNKFDENAVRIEAYSSRRKAWFDVGYVPKTVSGLIRIGLKKGIIKSVRMQSIGSGEGGFVGLNVKIICVE